MHQLDYQPIISLKWDHQDVLDFTTQPIANNLIFRGVKDSAYGLVPSAFRRDGMVKLKKEAKTYTKLCGVSPPRDDPSKNIELQEIMALLWFYDLANRQGLRVPDIPHAYSGIRYYDAISLSKSANLNFIDNWSEIAAVAQHYGVPTRMLDWTFDINVALYFAVKDLPNKRSGGKHPESVSLWVLDKIKAALLGSIKFVVPKYCDNPNIRAQSGLFTVIDASVSDPSSDLRDVICGRYQSATANVLSMIKWMNTPVLTRIDIAYEEALELKANFKDRSISYDSIFPGWSGVAESIEIQSDLKGDGDARLNDFMRSRGRDVEPYSPPSSRPRRQPPSR